MEAVRTHLSTYSTNTSTKYVAHQVYTATNTTTNFFCFFMTLGPRVQ